MTRLETRLSTPLVALGLLMVGVLVAVLLLIAARVDQSAMLHDQSMVERGLLTKTRDLERSIAPQSVWDDAVENLGNRFNPSWARENVGSYLLAQSSFDLIFVVDSDNRSVFGQKVGGELSPDFFSAHGESFAPVLSAVRDREARIKRVTAPRADGGLVSAPVQTSSYELIDGEAYLVTASLVQSDFGRATLKARRAPIIITALKLDASFLKTMSSRFLLDGIHLHPGAATPKAQDARVSIRSMTGRIVATMDWTPTSPGQALLRKAVVPILLVVGCLAAAVVIFASRSRRIAKGLVASEARAKHMAHHDSLTGLPNRSLFEARLNQALAGLDRRRGAMAVLGIDLDRFKAVNDTHGHNAGDELIRLMADRLAGLCRTNESVARLGGDEFALIVPEIDPAGAAALAERLVKALSEPADLSCGQVFVGGSVGVAMIDAAEAYIGAEEAARRADVAMYRAKEQGRNRYCFFEIEMDAALKARRGLEVDLRRALSDGGVHLVYQPQVDTTGQMTGVEALARWAHPTRGLISPATFVPLAEDCGLIEDLGRLVMRQAFADSRRWPGIKVAVNVSALQMRQEDFPSEVAKLLIETGAHPRSIELEITEGALLGDDETTHLAIGRLRAMGFSLALDDFGTGYSSLSYLRRYPIDKIKIDRSFITPLGEDSEAGALVASIVGLAKALNLSVIAEGVETDQQRSQLRDMGCTDAQGFLFSAAVDPEAVDAIVARGGQVKPQDLTAKT
ncbi:putative bifunctional diguanylate cyclase/phosphodiesterase [Caulobacter henricii]|uniref:Diguanylate cyclase n=1 Tax=Caulobacter henricii TaxID=69395 RepID=A0A0P0P3Q3_9CAUL|nr:EAL domain-containing protein [Caulobacter henricii]ALL15190.1 diguanylate cyclase [Caulobacter henricii]